MNQIFKTISDYELFLYSISELYPSIKKSTITLIKRGTSLARVSGDLSFANDYHLVIRERILYNCSPISIDWYGYEIWKGDQLICRYDPQPHHSEPSLQITFPHHKHIQPNINRNRIPSTEMSFDNPNIPFLIQEIENISKL